MTAVAGAPVLAVVGRPNVGKSTLVNRIIGRREAVVQDVPGVTRDRVSYDANWNGRAFTVVDTGGWDPDARGLAERIAAQAEVAVSVADAVLFVVDATVGITDSDEAVVRILRRSGKPVVLVANKVDDLRLEAEAAGRAGPLPGGALPAEALDEHRVVVQGHRVVEQRVEHRRAGFRIPQHRRQRLPRPSLLWKLRQPQHLLAPRLALQLRK